MNVTKEQISASLQNCINKNSKLEIRKMIGLQNQLLGWAFVDRSYRDKFFQPISKSLSAHHVPLNLGEDVALEILREFQAKIEAMRSNHD